MQRLREQVDSMDPAVRRAARILSSAAPLDADRFWNIQFPAHRSYRPGLPSLRAMALGAMTMGTFAASAAVIPRFHVGNVPWAASRAVARPRANSAPVADSSAPRDVAPGPDAVVREPAVAVPNEDAPTAVRVPAVGCAPSVVKTEAHSPAARVAHPPAKGAPAEGNNQADGESSLIVDAVRALRRDRDPARALSLAELAMDRYPQGAQAEEAMALGMEAASAAGDDAAARKLAERYLASFRGGPFADRALQFVAAPLR